LQQAQHVLPKTISQVEKSTKIAPYHKHKVCLHPSQAQVKLLKADTLKYISRLIGINWHNYCSPS
jgi:hypothetical protein